MLQSDRSLQEHASCAAKPEPADHMQDCCQFSSLVSDAFGCDMIGMFNGIFIWISFGGICRD